MLNRGLTLGNMTVGVANGEPVAPANGAEGLPEGGPSCSGADSAVAVGGLAIREMEGEDERGTLNADADGVSGNDGRHVDSAFAFGASGMEADSDQVVEAVGGTDPGMDGPWHKYSHESNPLLFALFAGDLVAAKAIAGGVFGERDRRCPWAWVPLPRP